MSIPPTMYSTSCLQNFIQNRILQSTLIQIDLAVRYAEMGSSNLAMPMRGCCCNTCMQLKHKCISCSCIQSGCHPIKQVSAIWLAAYPACQRKGEGYNVRGAPYLWCPWRDSLPTIVPRLLLLVQKGQRKENPSKKWIPGNVARCSSKAEMRWYDEITFACSLRQKRMID